MQIKEKLKRITYNIENNFFFTVIRHGLTMMIPLLLIGGIACALMNLPFIDYSDSSFNGTMAWLYSFLAAIYQGTFGLVSVALVIVLSLSYGMEKNETVDKVALYIIVALGAYGTQLNMSSPSFDISTLGPTGSFSAIFVTLLSCFCFEKLRKITILSLRRYAIGMETICANAIQMLLPMAIIVGFILLINQFLQVCLGVYSINELFSNVTCTMFANMGNHFGSGILYTLVIHVLWICGFHGSHVMEPVAQNIFSVVSEESIFSKSFFDTYVVMGGCGTTICLLLVLLLFYRKDRLGNYAKIASFTIIFNINEVLNFGIPIILNPVLGIPFILTPIVSYCIAYSATALGLVPQLVQEIPWSTPIIFSGYMATGSIRGAILQLVCIIVGMGIYYPFIRLHQKIQEEIAREKLKGLVRELQEKEQENETPQFLTRADSLGLISRILLDDLKTAIKQDTLFMLYQPQIDANGKCLGAEALLRWKHPLYGFIYPPLIIYLAKEGGILPELEAKILDSTAQAIQKTAQEFDGDFKISINITAKSLLWDIETCIDNCLKKYDIPTSRLWIEITEQDVISNADFVVDKLKRLHDKGHTLLIDDFGMGHTSLVYLQSNFFDIVKLDGSLVKNLLASKTNQKIVSSIVDLGKELNINVIAEYVETLELRHKLYELGCYWYQGYLYSKPLPLDDFLSYIKKHN